MIAAVTGAGIRVTTLVCGATADTEWSRDWDAGEMARFFEEATASGHLAMVSAGAPQRPEDVADVVRFVVTRPPGQMIDVIHARSISPASASRCRQRYWPVLARQKAETLARQGIPRPCRHNPEVGIMHLMPTSA